MELPQVPHEFHGASENQVKTNIKEEAEQGTLEFSVKFNPKKGHQEGSLPFIDPCMALADNMYIADKIFNTQMKAIENAIRADILKSLNKLRDKGYLILETKSAPRTLINWSSSLDPAIPYHGQFFLNLNLY
jgi:hypothetical protein